MKIYKMIQNHDNVVNVLEVFNEEGYFYIVYEYCDGGSLEDAL